MGCKQSAPVNDAIEPSVLSNPKIAPLGASIPGALPNSKDSVQLIVREKLFSWGGGDASVIKTRTGTPFNGLKVKGKVMPWRDRMTLFDKDDQLVAVCRKQFDLVGDGFKIYTTAPLYAGQTVSDRKYDNLIELYTYCRVERVPLSSVLQVTFDNEKEPTYTIHRTEDVWPKKRVVMCKDETAASMEGGVWEGDHNSYRLTIKPGVDPCLIVCLCAICDEIEESIPQ